MKQYYVYIPGDDSVQGPFPVAMIQNAYTQGIYNDAVMLQDVNGGDWVSIGSVFSKPLPPPPPVHVAVPGNNNDGAEKGNNSGLAAMKYIGILIVVFIAAFGRHFFRKNSFHDYPVFGWVVTIAVIAVIIGIIKESTRKK